MILNNFLHDYKIANVRLFLKFKVNSNLPLNTRFKGLNVPTNGAPRSRVGVVGKVLFSRARELIFSH